MAGVSLGIQQCVVAKLHGLYLGKRKKSRSALNKECGDGSSSSDDST
jgi:hypothetical protein